MSTEILCECGNGLYELEERESGRCRVCFIRVRKQAEVRMPKGWKQQTDSDGLFNPDVPNPSEDV